MSDRTVAEAVTRRLGADTLARLRSLRRRLWWRRSVRAGVLILAAAVLCIALVQLVSRAFPFELLGMTLVAITAWLGAAADTRRGFDPLWHLGSAGVALTFNLGAFVVEYAAILAQARLLLEVKAQADKLRLAQTSDR